MVRQSFRIGLRLGLLVGITVALVKTIQARRARSPLAGDPGPWEPLADERVSPPGGAGPAGGPTNGAVAPAPPARRPGPNGSTGGPPPGRPVDEVGEPVVEPAGPEGGPGTGDGHRSGRARTELTEAERAAVEAELAEPPGKGPSRTAGPEGAKASATGRASASGKAPAARKGPASGKAPARRKAPGKGTGAAPPAKGGPGRAAAWVEPDGGACPTSHPVKAKLTSRLFHLPGMAAYARTKADRCYRDGPSAEGDGFTRAKR